VSVVCKNQVPNLGELRKSTWSVNQLFFISINEKLFDQNIFIVLPLTELSATLSFAQFA
jgi:hypothetical protein